jgi:hypothetical protein
MRLAGQPLQTSYLLFWAQKEGIPIYISPCCIYSITYVLEKSGIKAQQLQSVIEKYLTLLNLCTVNKELFYSGLKTNFRDLKDAFQYMHSLEEKCDYLIRSNIKDYKPYVDDRIPVLTPAQFLSQVLNKKAGIDY